MNTQFTPKPTSLVPEKNTSQRLKGIINMYLFHWPLFVVCLLITLVPAIIYISYAKPLYEVKATLIIKDDSKEPDQQRSALHEIDLSDVSKKIENEVEVLKSKQLIGKVIHDLDLSVNYFITKGISKHDLYKETPVRLAFTGDINYPDNYNKVNLTIKDSKSGTFKDSDGSEKNITFGQPFKSLFGETTIQSTPLLKDYIGREIGIIVSDPEDLALYYQKEIQVSTPNKLSTAVSLSLKDSNPGRGKDILNRLIINYNLAGTVEKNRETKSTLDFIDERLSSLTGELNDAEKGIETFKSSRGLTDISADSKISLENMQSNDAKLNEINVQLNTINGIERYVNSSLNSGKAPTTLGITDPTLISLVEKLNDLQLQRERLLATTPETNPDFEPINRQLSITKAAIKESVRNIKSSLSSTLSQLQSFNNRFETSIKDIPKQERQYISIKRQQAIKESLYTYLLQKKEEVSVRYAATLTDDRVVDKAYAAKARNPLKMVALAAAFIFGFCIPIGIIRGRNSLTNKITDVEDIKEKTGLQVISQFPYQSEENFLIFESKEVSAITEQFRALRTKLHSLLPEKNNARTLMVTSSIPGEGKSFTTVNLASSLAISGKKTILIELDMRRPKLGTVINQPNVTPGISEYLGGKAEFEDIIKPSAIRQGLDVIFSGVVPENPSEMLEGTKLTELISKLEQLYDFILLDTPPVHLVPDALIVSHFADLTLYLMRQGVTGKAELEFLRETVSENNLSNVQVIFNGVQSAKFGSGYEYTDTYYTSKKRSWIANVFSNFSNRF
ncbi:GumC family protein [Mucilaginibacter lutimaris]|uniref:non-specific protein-tyrosine kinase n=1 Tax=Mucilaginibacter lutimaris TaxID=931629 RepID=A0ABW2ZL04_9SPHI